MVLTSACLFFFRLGHVETSHYGIMYCMIMCGGGPLIQKLTVMLNF